MTHILSTLFPIFAIIALGFGLARSAFLSRGFLNELNRFVYWVCLPALIARSVANATAVPVQTLLSSIIFIAASSVVILLAFACARWRGLERWQFGTFVQASFRGNLAFIGIPVIAYASRHQGPAAVDAIISEAVFLFIPLMIFYNIVSVSVLVGSRQSDLSNSLPQTLRGIATNPLIISALVGFLLFLLPFNLPLPLDNTLEFIARTASPAALICAGGGMAFVSMQGRYRSALLASLLKTAALPLSVFLLTRPFNLPADTSLILMVYAATPTAIVSYVMAKELGGDEPMASGAIVLSTLLSSLSLALVIGLF